MDKAEQHRFFRETLLRWNAKVNLIGPEARETLDEHIEEARFAAEVLRPSGEVLDFGSGGGLPAIPMAIESPAARFHLVESDQRKWAFLKHVVRECQLNCVVHGDRLARVLPRLDPGLRFTLITSRAVGRGEDWIPLVVGKLAAAGRIALFQSSPAGPPLTKAVVDRVVRLPRGENNYLVILAARQVEQNG